MNKVEVDPRLLGDSQSTVSPRHSPENQMRSEGEPVKINGAASFEEESAEEVAAAEAAAEIAAVEHDAASSIPEHAPAEPAVPCLL